MDIIKNLRGENIVDNARVDGVFSSLWKSNPEELTAIGEHLIDETQNIDKRIAIYKAEMRALCPKEWNNCANDERTAAAILTCKYPLKYTVYKDEIYQLICRYFGFESRKAGKKFSLKIEEPKTGVTKAEIDAAMQVVVENNVFNTSGGNIVEAVEGRLRTITTDVVAE